MPSILVCAMPLDGHVGPMLTVARILVTAGHEVGFLTGAGYADAVRRTGARHVALPAVADITQEMLDAGRAQDGRRLSGIGFAIDNTRRCFIATMPGWLEAIDRELAARPVDVIAAEAMVFAIGPLLNRRRPQRPAIVACGAFPVILRSRDTAPVMLGLPPMPGPIGRLRNAVLNLLVEKVIFGGLQREADAVCRAGTGTVLPAFLPDWARLADAYVQFGVASFEYPRGDAPSTLSFVGPLPSMGSGTPLPEWWPDVAAADHVVLVSQGTLANRDFSELILPTLEALRDTGSLVVVSTGGRPEGDLGPLPPNVRATRMLDYDRVMREVDVFVTNGGFGSLNAALAHGVPIVVAGDTEDKVETSARVAWSGAGAGVSLRTGTPTSAQLRDAVERVLRDPAYRTAAARIQQDIAAAPREKGLLAAVENLVAAA